jgi:hypothetical protein
MRRFGRSRCSDPSVHDGPISALTHAAEAPSCYDTGALVTPGRVPTRLFFFGGNGFSEACK